MSQRSASARVLFPSRPLPPSVTGTVVEVTRARARWQWVHFAVRQVAPGAPWHGRTGEEECCLVLLQGACRVAYQGPRAAPDGSGSAGLGPRRDVFAGYPHALYLPRRTRFTVTADERTELADGRAPSTRQLTPRLVRPADCGGEIRGGANATRQIIDIIPPGFPADRLLVCEVFTPGGNWSSYPPHKHDEDRPPAEVRLEEVYYYRFAHQDAYGIQRLYGPAADRAITVGHGDVVLIRSGYHPFVTAHGYDAYYLNVLAGTRRSMAASDDPRYASFRAWPPPDPRLPVVPPPAAEQR